MSSTFDTAAGGIRPPTANDNSSLPEGEPAAIPPDMTTPSNGDSEFGRLSVRTRKDRPPKTPQGVTSDIVQPPPVQLDEVVLLGPLVETVLKRLKANAANDN